MDKGRFNPQHTIGQAKPLLVPWHLEKAGNHPMPPGFKMLQIEVKDAVENSGAAIELFAPVQGESDSPKHVLILLVLWFWWFYIETLDLFWICLMFEGASNWIWYESYYILRVCWISVSKAGVSVSSVHCQIWRETMETSDTLLCSYKRLGFVEVWMRSATSPVDQ